MGKAKLWTVSMLATATGVTGATITDALRRKVLRGDLVGRTWFVQPEDARAYVAKRKALAKAVDAVGRSS